MYGIKDVTKHYNSLKVLDNISMDFHKDKTTCILGPSGCGKTTILNIIVGATNFESGKVIGFEEDISFVFQEDRLIPWKTVNDNIAFVLKKKMGKEQLQTTIDKYLDLVHLKDYKHYYPKDLSGGMTQRISILRAFAYPSKLLIMDEPFKSLDINNKSILYNYFNKLMDNENRTCILVTHDIDEAIKLGDRIILLSQKPTKVILTIENDRNDNQLKDKIEKILLEQM